MSQELLATSPKLILVDFERGEKSSLNVMIINLTKANSEKTVTNDQGGHTIYIIVGYQCTQ